MNDKTTARVMKTDNYELFKFADSNRAVSAAQVNRIIESIKKVGVIPAPIIVNERMEVLDGQHRLAALKALGEPVYYLQINGIGMAEAVQMNAINAKWKNTDYINHFAAEGLPDYVFLKKMLTEFKALPDCVVVGVICRNKDTKKSNTKQIASGTFKLVGTEAEAVETLRFLSSFAPTIKTAKEGRKSNLYMALAWIHQNADLFDINMPRLHRAIRNIAAYEISLSKTMDFMVAIQNEYNRGELKAKKQFFKNRYDEYINTCA